MTEVIHGDCREVLAGWADAEVDAVVTDPPYGIGFMGKDWDYDVPGPEFWAAILRVVRPGANLVAFGAPKKDHRLACAIEDAGWELRDKLAWFYGQGYPKSKALLKPGFEPIVLACRPGGSPWLNIDASRIPAERKGGHTKPSDRAALLRAREDSREIGPSAGDPCDGLGRWPANVVLDEEAAQLLDAQSGVLTSGVGAVKRASARGRAARSSSIGAESRAEGTEMITYGDSGGASRFFYVAKASRAERTHNGTITNKHPTVKPLALMRWLVRLVTPQGGLVLDPFCGSGTTLLAAREEGFEAVGIDQDAESVRISRARLIVA